MPRKDKNAEATAKKATEKPASVKGYCEDLLRKGKTPGQAMSMLKKKFPEKEEAVLDKSLKYYASALCKAGEITDEYKAKFVGSRGRGKTAATVNASKASRRKAAATSKEDGTAATEEKPARATRRKATTKKSAASSSAKTSGRKKTASKAK